ncbi:MAG TPA: hypothetical protein VGY56_05135 [Verrucomicrobiae bacterium]|nr:hypothetical protein [Verrucomicrobiae bacterium]
MSPAEIISEIMKLSQTDRREILRRILEVESDAQGFSDSDQRALERFQLLNAMEAEPKQSDNQITQ